MTPEGTTGSVDLAALRREAIECIAAAEDEQRLEELRVQFLGRRAVLTQVLSGIGALPAEERGRAGKEGNETRRALEGALADRLQQFREAGAASLAGAEAIDLTVPAGRSRRGHLHPISRVMREIEEIFRGLGYDVARGPEVETDYYNFEALNLPPGHPARDNFDSFYIADDEEARRLQGDLVGASAAETKILLRAHTSPMQIRVMERQKPPIKVIVPGKTYRRDNDATHSPMFHQVEGVHIDEGITMADLKGTLEYFARAMFGDDRRIRLRPDHFPFTEPSAQIEVSCFQCDGSGCRLCGHSGWIEILGAGMMHPNVLRSGGIDARQYSGFAFGLGGDRIAMLKYGIDDLRTMFEGDVRFIRQF